MSDNARRGRPPKAAPPPPPAEEEEDEEGDGSDPDDPDVPESDKPEADTAPPPPRKPAPKSPLDERVTGPGAAPGSMRFPGGFPQPGAAGPGSNRLPPLIPTTQFGQRPMVDARQREAPQRDGSSDYGAPADRIEGEKHGGTEGRIARDFLGEYDDDLRVSVHVWQATPGQNFPRGMLENVMLSWARIPEHYIPYGGLGGEGKWHLEFFSAQTGKLLDRITVTLPGEEPPADWRVETAMEEQRTLKTLLDLLRGGTGGLGGGGISKDIYSNETDYWRRKSDEQEKRLQDLERQRMQDRLDSQQRDFEFRMKMLESGGAGGGQSQVLQTITALVPILQPQRNTDDRLIDLVLRANGPEMMMAQAGMYNSILDAAFKMGKGGSGDGDLKSIIAGGLKDASCEYIKGLNKRQEARDQFTMEMKRKEADAAAAKANGGQQPAAQAVPPPATAAQPTNGKSVERMLFVRMISDVKAALARVADPAVPIADKPSEKDVARKLALCFMTTIENRLHQADSQVKEMTDEMLSDPESFISKFAVAYNLSVDYAARLSVEFRKIADLPPLQKPSAPSMTEASLAPPAPAKPTAPAEQPVVTSTIRLDGSPAPEKPKAPAAPADVLPSASAVRAEPVAAGSGGDKPAPQATMTPEAEQPPAPPPPSPKVEAQHAVEGQVGEPQGAVHVVDAGPQAPAAQRVDEGDAQGEGREPAQEDGVRLVEPAGAPAEVQEPPVP